MQAGGFGFKSESRWQIILPMLGLLCLSALLFLQISRLITTNRQVSRSDQVITQAHATENLIVDMETGIRGYALTRDPVFLKPYDSARRQLASSFERFRE